MPSRDPAGDTSANEGALAVAVTTAVASVLGNIVQLVDRQELAAEAGVLRQRQAHLLAVFGQWQEAHGQLCLTAERQRTQLAAAHSREADLEREIQRLRTRVVELEARAATSEADGQDAAR